MKQSHPSALNAVGAEHVPSVPFAGTMYYLGQRPLATEHGEFNCHMFQDVSTDRTLLALGYGDLSGTEPLLARVHSACVTSEIWSARDCDCAEQLDVALSAIARAGRGLFFHLMQEGRGAGFSAKARDRMLVQASGGQLTTFEAYEQMGLVHDRRRYADVRSVCNLLGITAPLKLLTNNPEKASCLTDEGVTIAAMEPLRRDPSPFNLHYLRSKLHSGHLLSPSAGESLDAAHPPVSVRVFEPYALPDVPQMIHVARYQLPVQIEEFAWFRVDAYYDLQAGQERVVLSHGDPTSERERAPLLHVQRESLLARFPLRPSAPGRLVWRAAMREIIRHGAGVALFLPCGPYAEIFGNRSCIPEDLDAASALLMRHHLGPKQRGHLLYIGSEQPHETASELRRRQVNLLDPVPIAMDPILTPPAHVA